MVRDRRSRNVSAKDGGGGGCAVEKVEYNLE